MSLIPIFTGGLKFVATGGTTYTQGGYNYHKFTSSGSFTVVSGTRTLEYLVVAGGGAGGNSSNGFTGNGQFTASGGGGGGGVLNGTYSSISLIVTVGSGGTPFGTGQGQDSTLLTNPPGPASPALVATAIGGGRGADGISAAVIGGSGGGGSVKDNGLGAVFFASAAGTAGQGNAGANAPNPQGGGGGGSAAAASGATAGAGLTTYTSWWDVSAPAQISKGGAGGNSTGGGANGSVNTGNAGGGSYSANNSLQASGSGGSGIVIIRYIA